MTFVHVGHLGHGPLALALDEVIRQQDGEGLVTHDGLGAEDGMAQA